MNSIEGKWALVTGASRGIGRVVAEGLAQRGCHIVIHGRTEAACEQTRKAVVSKGREAIVVAAELGDEAQVEHLIDTVMKRLGGVDILYNNAGIQNPWKEICDITTEDWQKTFAINVFAPARLCAAFIPVMQQRGFGRIVNVSSGIRGCPQLSPYGASKWALDKYTEELACQLAETNVIVNGMDPGWIKTDLGGPNADHDLSTVLPGMLVPVLLQPGDPAGHKYRAQDFKHLK